MTDAIAIAIVLTVLAVLVPPMVWAVRAVKSRKRRRGGFDAVYAMFYAFSTPFERAPQHVNEANSPERVKKPESGGPPSKD